MIRCIEFAAGRRHYAHYRHFLSRGGIPKLAARHGLTIERQKRVSGGNIGIYKLRRDLASNRNPDRLKRKAPNNPGGTSSKEYE
jgi:hypothetical protein